MKFAYLFFTILYFTSSIIAQEISQKETLLEAYTSYFDTERETIYLHFNKNVFITQEPIWFKGYVYDKKNGQPFINTTNVYVALYDTEGNEIRNKLFFAQNGTFSGSFDNQNELKSGNYFIRAYTNWMNNFEEDESYVSKAIQIINPESVPDKGSLAPMTEHDLQFLPEGGHLVSNVNNTIGFKITDCAAQGIIIEGTVLNSKQETVANFKSNKLGMGKFDLMVKREDTYTAHYAIEGKEYSITLPKSEPEGFAIAVNNYTNAKMAYVSLKTNEATLQSEANKTYYLVISQNNKVSVVDIDINTLKTENTIPIPTANLASGINTITLFDDQLHPLLERLIFNYTENSFLKSSIYSTKTANDSLSIHIKTSQKDNSPISTNLSIAILPQTSVAYSNREDIISAFMLEPYINGDVQDPGYYFEDIDRLKTYNLDLLLLTQGWSKYKWENIKNGAQALTHLFDVGLTVRGIANIPKTNRQGYYVQMFSIPNHLNEQASIEDDNHFYFKNFYLKDSAQINFTVYRDGIKIDKIKPVLELEGVNRQLTKHPWQVKKTCAYHTVKNNGAINPMRILGNGKEQFLDTVNLSYVRIKDEDNLQYKKSYIANSYSKGIKIDSITKRYYNYVTDIINAHGFVVDQLPGAGQVRIKNRNPVSFLASNEPLLIVDDISYGHSYDVIYNMLLDDIDEIYIDPNGNGYGSQGSAGVIRIYKKKGAFAKKGLQNNSSQEFTIKNGFSTEKEFYVPEFYMQSKADFLRYGTIDWKSNIITDAKGNATYKIYDNGFKEAIMILQGFSADGKLLSEIKEIKLLE
ncbi:MAG: hypothetical protein R2783_00645 [Gelidibacter sp.]